MHHRLQHLLVRLKTMVPCSIGKCEHYMCTCKHPRVSLLSVSAASTQVRLFGQPRYILNLSNRLSLPLRVSICLCRYYDSIYSLKEYVLEDRLGHHIWDIASHNRVSGKPSEHGSGVSRDDRPSVGHRLYKTRLVIENIRGVHAARDGMLLEPDHQG